MVITEGEYGQYKSPAFSLAAPMKHFNFRVLEGMSSFQDSECCNHSPQRQLWRQSGSQMQHAVTVSEVDYNITSLADKTTTLGVLKTGHALQRSEIEIFHSSSLLRRALLLSAFATEILLQ